MDGNFDSLAIGNAPSVGVPAGHWSFPSDYVSEGIAETNVSEFSIAFAPGGANGNSLHLSADTSILESQHLPNIFTQGVNKGAGLFLIASFDIYIAAGRGGGAVYLGNGWNNSTSRGPQIGWDFAGNLYYADSDGSVNVLASYPQGVWQSVRIEVDIDHDRYNLYSGQRGFPFSTISSNLPYRSGSLPFIDRFTIARFTSLPDADAYFDNIVAGLRAPTTIVLTGGKILSNGSFQFALTNSPGTLFSVLTTTNLALPLTNWTVLSGVTEISPGQYQFTDPQATNNSQRFYSIRSP